MEEKNFRVLFELIAKEKTPMGAIELRIMKEFGELAEKHGFDCYVKGTPADKLEHKPNNETYEIKTVEDIAKLSSTQFEFFVDDLRAFCNLRRNLQGLKDADLIDDFGSEQEGMTWIDTGKNEAKIQATIQTTNKL